ncbi:uncharacterized protein EMH_0051460 [Eimeria mitis]|uniref:Uncharacterized protein n=1 Tax=Eimeria mitis TaxID=44415 RepID=U6K5L9_9EIME|nr:uncharacterized protein EMH_0051460 [Eimeria mitis]CDJ33149.1 hypothetical protein, conserved [Eimeria mitis]
MTRIDIRYFLPVFGNSLLNRRDKRRERENRITWCYYHQQQHHRVFFTASAPPPGSLLPFAACPSTTNQIGELLKQMQNRDLPQQQQLYDVYGVLAKYHKKFQQPTAAEKLQPPDQ